ncbi:MAG: TadE/TadG family type IV pilus assembly protein, partial [Bellilinea sp.]
MVHLRRNPQKPIQRIRRSRLWREGRAQSFVELALVLPVLIIMLLGVVEVAIFIGRYLDILDLTREAARFASVRDPFQYAPPTTWPAGQNCNAAQNPARPVGVDFYNINERCMTCSDPQYFHFYYTTACIFSPPAGSDTCRTNDPFCNGLNPYVTFNPATDDVVISVYTVSNRTVTHVWPRDDVWPNTGYWALSDHDEDTNHNGNWRTDCRGNIVRSQPYYTRDRVIKKFAAENVDIIALLGVDELDNLLDRLLARLIAKLPDSVQAVLPKEFLE